jgi:hypothetical protein
LQFGSPHVHRLRQMFAALQSRGVTTLVGTARALGAVSHNLR